MSHVFAIADRTYPLYEMIHIEWSIHSNACSVQDYVPTVHAPAIIWGQNRWWRQLDVEILSGQWGEPACTQGLLHLCTKSASCFWGGIIDASPNTQGKLPEVLYDKNTKCLKITKVLVPKVSSLSSMFA
jgi:hypothetical protein